MSWDVSSILLDTSNVRGVIRLDTPALQLSFGDWNAIQKNFPNANRIQCKSTQQGLLECVYDSNRNGDFSTKPEGPYCCPHKSPKCCSVQGAFNVDCPDNTHILFQKMVSQPSKTECIVPPDAGGMPICTTTAISTCYKACGRLDCVKTCSLGNATGQCLDGIVDPIPKCPSTPCPTNTCSANECLSNQGKCGVGDIFQSNGNLQNLNEGWVVCQFTYDFRTYQRSSQPALLRWIIDLFSYSPPDPSKPRMTPFFSIPMILNAILHQSSTLVYNEMYTSLVSSPLINVKPFSVSHDKEYRQYLDNILNPILLPLQQTEFPSLLTNFDSLLSTIQSHLPPPTLLNPLTLSLRLNSLQFQTFTQLTDDDQRSDMLAKYLATFLREDKTLLFLVSKDGTSPSQRLSVSTPRLMNPRTQSVLTIQTTPTDSSKFFFNIQSYDYQERRSLPSGACIFAYDVVCTIQTFSPMLVAYVQLHSPFIPPDIAESMYQDANVYPYGNGTFYNDDECRKQLRNPSAANTVNDLGRLVYGYYSPNCKCIISNIAPVDQSQFHNMTSMCFDLNCTSPDMIQRYNLDDQTCASPSICDTVSQWGDLIQNSQNFNQQRFDGLCKTSQKQRLQNLQYNIVILILTVVLTCLVLLLLSRANILLAVAIAIILLFIGIFLSVDMYGIPVCTNDQQTQCQSQLTGIGLPVMMCQDRYRWCECISNTETCVCKSGILVPIDGNVQIQISQEKKWNFVYGIFVLLIYVVTVTVLLTYTRRSSLGVGARWALLIILTLTMGVGQFLCRVSYPVYKNISGCVK